MSLRQSSEQAYACVVARGDASVATSRVARKAIASARYNGSFCSRSRSLLVARIPSGSLSLFPSYSIPKKL